MRRGSRWIPWVVMASLSFFECQRAPAPVPLSREQQLAQALEKARTSGQREQLLQKLPAVSGGTWWPRVLLWVDHQTVTLDDLDLLDSFSHPVLLDRLDAGRGFGVRTVADAGGELEAIDRDQWKTQNLSFVFPGVALTADTPVRELIVSTLTLDDAHLRLNLRVAVRADGGLASLPVVPRGPAWHEPEACAHPHFDGEQERPPCSLPGLWISSRGWCAWAEGGLVGSRCVSESESYNPDEVAQRARRPKDTRPTLLEELLQGKDVEPSGPPMPIYEHECRWTTKEQALELLSKLAAKHPGCVAAKVFAQENLPWGEVAPALAEVNARGFLPFLWLASQYDDLPDGGLAVHRDSR